MRTTRKPSVTVPLLLGALGALAAAPPAALAVKPSETNFLTDEGTIEPRPAPRWVTNIIAERDKQFERILAALSEIAGELRKQPKLSGKHEQLSWQYSKLLDEYLGLLKKPISSPPYPIVLADRDPNTIYIGLGLGGYRVPTESHERMKDFALGELDKVLFAPVGMAFHKPSTWTHLERLLGKLGLTSHGAMSQSLPARIERLWQLFGPEPNVIVQSPDDERPFPLLLGMLKELLERAEGQGVQKVVFIGIMGSEKRLWIGGVKWLGHWVIQNWAMCGLDTRNIEVEHGGYRPIRKREGTSEQVAAFGIRGEFRKFLREKVLPRIGIYVSRERFPPGIHARKLLEAGLAKAYFKRLLRGRGDKKE